MSIKKKPLLIFFSILVVFISFVFLNLDVAFAERKTSDEQLIKLHKEMEYILHLDHGWFIQDFIRLIGAGAIFSLAWLNSFVEGIIDKVITLNDFYSSGPIQEFMEMARPVVWGVFFIALFVLGFQFMFNKIEKRNEVIINVILALCVIVVIPDLMVNMGKVTNLGVEQINPENKKLANELVKSNVADVLYYAEGNFEFSNKKDGDKYLPPKPMSKEDSRIGTTDFTYANRLSEKSLPYLPVTQKLDFHEDEAKLLKWKTKNWVKELKDKNPPQAYEALKTQSISTGYGDDFTIVELEKNTVPSTKMGRESYYRYHVNWGVLIVSLLVTTLALVITVIKIGRSIFDLAFHQIFGMFIAATDLTGGQRTKKVLVEIMNTFAVIFIMTMLLKLFILYSSWANGLKGSIGGVGVLLLLIAGAWALIDAPDIVQRMLGIDAGLRSGYQAMLGAYAGARLAGTGTKAVGKGIEKGLGLAGKATTGLAGGANFARRTVSGIASKTPEEMAGRSRRVPVKPMPGIAAKGEISKHGSEKMKGNGDSPKMADEGIKDGISASGNEQLDSASQSKQNSSEPYVNGAIPSQSSVHAKENGISKIQSSNIKGTERQMKGPVSAGKGTSLKSKRQSVEASSQVGIGQGQRQQNIPSGYAQTASGILVPGSAADMETSQNMQSSHSAHLTSSNVSAQPSHSSILPTGSNQDRIYTEGTVETPSDDEKSGYVLSSPGGQKVHHTTTAPSSGLSKQSKSYGHKEVHHTNTLAGGNRHIQQAKEQIVRAGNSGFSLGQSIRRLGRGSGNAAIQTARAVVHPTQTLQTGIDKTKSATHTRVNNLKQSMNSAVHQIKIPPGHRMNRKGKHNE
ncbi:pLS20_p028 family conjugation system transmembrane protein [Siminovitchia sediminis]|uniref:PLS20_p028 family conjugation system transmembrane protein n=1 Tax=Siminovitchia sediminis TaxID=1274353 RepID=A0ABW4KJY6_9BACI